MKKWVFVCAMLVVGCSNVSTAKFEKKMMTEEGKSSAVDPIRVVKVSTLVEAYSPQREMISNEIETAALTCTGRSEILNRDGAWKCATKSESYDLCFELLNDDLMLCDGRPNDRLAGDLYAYATDDLPNVVTRPELQPVPWLLQLSDGRECVRSKLHEVVAYACDDGGELDKQIHTEEARWAAMDVVSGEVVEIEKAWVY